MSLIKIIPYLRSSLFSFRVFCSSTYCFLHLILYYALFLQLLSVFSEFETNLRRERPMEGIERAKQRGVYKGRRPTIDKKKVVELKTQGLNPTEIAREMGINRSSVYRVMKSA